MFYSSYGAMVNVLLTNSVNWFPAVYYMRIRAGCWHWIALSCAIYPSKKILLQIDVGRLNTENTKGSESPLVAVVYQV